MITKQNKHKAHTKVDGTCFLSWYTGAEYDEMKRDDNLVPLNMMRSDELKCEELMHEEMRTVTLDHKSRRHMFSYLVYRRTTNTKTVLTKNTKCSQMMKNCQRIMDRW